MKTTLECLLPFQLPRLNDTEVDTNPTNSGNEDGLHRSSESMVELYRQTVPLVQFHSTAAIKTLGAIARDRKLVKRMLQRSPPYAKQLDRRPLTFTSSASRWSDVPLAALPLSPGKRTLRSCCGRRLAFMAACENLIVTFDPQVQQTRRIKLARIQPLFRYHGLEVDAAAFRRWEQCLQPLESTTTPTVSVSDFIQGCQLWFTDTFLIEYVRRFLPQLRPHCAVKEAKGKHTKLSPLQHEYQQSRIRANQQPFDQLANESDATSTFSYQSYAHHPPAPLIPSASAPALLHAKYCSYHKPDSATSAAGDDIKRAEQQQRRTKLETAKLARQSRQLSAEITRNFSARVAMICRHGHKDGIRKHTEHQLNVQIARTDRSRHWSQQHKAHCEAIEQDARAHRIREVYAMKALAAEELVLARNFQALREEVVRCNKPLFTLSSSTSTLFPAPLEVPAACALTSTEVDRQPLSRGDREHVEHMRSLQLLDYAHDRKRMITDALQPCAKSALVKVDVTDDKLPAERVVQLAGDELWHQITQQLSNDPNSSAVFVPPCNMLPAALHYCGKSRPVSMPAFASSFDRKLRM